jgi:hypothetical protein
MTRRVLLPLVLGYGFLITVRAQAPASAPQPSAVTRTAYSKNTEALYRVAANDRRPGHSTDGAPHTNRRSF